uniref:Uncharacterized protein n=1 Tax=Hanusia phi TaxID=3032 RepID=A0A7S0HEK4_9CRYP|mmetsp:Transcript_15341/g.35179  ORF Transcript_15341/g.35179 Transcript_15341/m.35179 type:complete len:103 (+) Transcript_15341:121-429(+)
MKMRLLCLCLLSLLSSSSSQRPASIDVLSSAKCANNEYRDSCGICNGDGGSCATMATVFLFLLLLMIIGTCAIWARLWYHKEVFDSIVRGDHQDTAIADEES